MAQLMTEPIVIHEGSQPRRFVLTCEELQCHPQDGGPAHAVIIADQKTAVATVDYLADLSRTSGDDFDLVMYEQGGKNRRVLRRKLVVKLAPGGVLPVTPEMKAVVTQPEYAPGFHVVKFPDAGDSLKYLPVFRKSAAVISAEPVMARKRFKRAAPNDPRYAWSSENQSYQWHLKNTGQNDGVAGIDANVESVWDTYTGMGVTIGIVDDGLEVAHPDLSPNTLTDIDYNWNDGSADDPTPTVAFDDHGTACAGVSAGKGNNTIGITGAAPNANLVGLRLIAGDVSDRQEAEAMSWESGLIQIKNNSWGPQDSLVELEDAGELVKAAFKTTCETGRGGRGTIHLWAAGNGGSTDNVNYDGYANSIYTIAIGAVTDTGVRSDYSEPGAAKVVSAPSDGGGQGITTTTLTSGGGYQDDFGGTSSATPLAAGVCALMLEANLNLGWRDVQEILIASARKINPTDPDWVTNGGGYHFNHDFGAGLIDAEAAVAMASGWQRLPEQESVQLVNDNLSLSIPDADEVGVTTTFDLTGQPLLRVEHVTVTVNLMHEYRGDIAISLISPDGTESRLTEAHMEDEEDYTNWKLMSVFHWGENSAGLWRVKVRDAQEDDEGVLNSVELELFGTSVPPPTEAPVFTSPAMVSGNLESFFELSLKAENQPTSFSAGVLPAGLEFDPAARRIFGTPTEMGDFTIEVTATNEIGTTLQTLSLVINDRIPTPPVIISDLKEQVLLGQPLIYQLIATNEPTELAASSLPDGVSFDSATGQFSGSPGPVGIYEIDLEARNADGVVSATLCLEVIDPAANPLNQALDNLVLAFESLGTNAWFSQSEMATAGGAALQSAAIADNEASTITGKVIGPGVLFFRWKVSSEENFDELLFLLDGGEEFSISGEVDWEERGIEIPAGEHDLTWRYQKDFSESDGDDAAWLDRVSFVSGLQRPSLGEALDYRGLDWENESEWFGQIVVTSDGEDAVASGSVLESDEFILRTFVDNGPGVLTFFYRTGTEEFLDEMLFVTDFDSIRLRVNEGRPWTKATFRIEEQFQTLEWKYLKGVGNPLGERRIWLDQVTWRPDSFRDVDLWFAQNLARTETYDGDADGDDRENLLEYALGSDPQVADSLNEPLATRVGDQDFFTFVADTSKVDLIYQPKYSVDLDTWLPLGTEVIESNGFLETRRATLPKSDGVRFFRLEIGIRE